MSIPLVQNNEKDAINTSIIAIKRNIERINMLLGLVDNDSPDLSGFATKQELQDAVTELQPVDEVTVDNMQSVSSNAVARALLGYSQGWKNYRAFSIKIKFPVSYCFTPIFYSIWTTDSFDYGCIMLGAEGEVNYLVGTHNYFSVSTSAVGTLTVLFTFSATVYQITTINLFAPSDWVVS